MTHKAIRSNGTVWYSLSKVVIVVRIDPTAAGRVSKPAGGYALTSSLKVQDSLKNGRDLSSHQHVLCRVEPLGYGQYVDAKMLIVHTSVTPIKPEVQS